MRILELKLLNISRNRVEYKETKPIFKPKALMKKGSGFSRKLNERKLYDVIPHLESWWTLFQIFILGIFIEHKIIQI
jgi:hypothetical protein